MKENKIFSYTVVIMVYVLAILTGKYTLDFLHLDSPYLEMLVADGMATVIVFIFSYLFKNSSLYDPYWSVIPVPIVIYWIWNAGQGSDIRQLLLLTVIGFWSIRLTVNWIKSWPNLKHEDWRYQKLKKDTGKYYWLVSFLGIHLFPTLIVFLGLLPVLPAVNNTASLGILDFLGMLICLSGVFLEYISDEQLRKFKNSNPARGLNMDKRLWSISRHPNYLGEILFWFGLFVINLSGNILSNLWTGIGFLSMYVLFKFISIPMMEKRLVKSKDQYEDYIKNVPALVPRFWK
jgi:steroid 5-alpha reductase family enzyme